MLEVAGGLAVVVDPCTIVKLSVVLLDQTLAVDLHVVDTVNWKSVGDLGSNRPSPGDGGAVVPDVKSGNNNFGLEDTLAVVESGLVGEGNSAELEKN